MIIDKMTHVLDYTLPHLEDALTCLEQVKNAAPGRFEFDGGFILIQEGITTAIEQGDFEAHRKYLDVQILLDGTETILWADQEDLSVTSAYNEQADRSSHSGSGSTIQVSPGMFYVCFPHDAHKCCCHINVPTTFRKAVVKLRLAT